MSYPSFKDSTGKVSSCARMKKHTRLREGRLIGNTAPWMVWILADPKQQWGVRAEIGRYLWQVRLLASKARKP